MWTLERSIFRVTTFYVFGQSSFQVIRFITFLATELFYPLLWSLMCLFMFSKVTFLSEVLETLCAPERLLASVYLLVTFQLACILEFLVTLGAIKGPLIRMNGIFMSSHMI